MGALALFSQQLKAKAGSFMIWITIWVLLLWLFAVVFKSLSRNAAESAKTFEQLPAGIFNAFNINPASYLTNVENFLSGQLLFVYLIAGSIFAFALGSNAIGKRMESGTIASFLTKPISRTNLYATMGLVNGLFIFASSAVTGMLGWLIFNAIVPNISISLSYFTGLFLGAALVFLAFMFLGMLIGVVAGGGKSLQIGAGIAVVSWFISSLGEFANIPKLIQAFSLFHYLDIPLLRDSFKLDLGLSLIITGISATLLCIGALIFRTKNIYL